MNTIGKLYKEESESIKKQIWENGLFVFDTNFLLNFFRSSKNVRSQLFSILELLEKQIWIPDQVAHEFYRNKENVRVQREEAYTQITPKVDEFVSFCTNTLRYSDSEKNKLKKSIESYLEKAEKEFDFWVSTSVPPPTITTGRKRRNLRMRSPASDTIPSAFITLKTIFWIRRRQIPPPSILQCWINCNI